MTILLLAIPLAYLLGAIPFGYLIARAKGIDIRQHGSKNIGATNVRRVLGTKAGNLCLALDMLKGFVPTLAPGFMAGMVLAPIPNAGAAALWLAVAIASIIGHMFPAYLRFRGGKGVATGFGAIVALWPVGSIAALSSLLIWIITARATRYISVASCAAAGALPITALGAAMLAPRVHPAAPSLGVVWPMLVGFTLIAVFVLIKHRANLARVRSGTEPRIGQSRPAPGTTA